MDMVGDPERVARSFSRHLRAENKGSQNLLHNSARRWAALVSVPPPD